MDTSNSWSLCEDGKYMTGMWRNDFNPHDERPGRIEYAECRDAPSRLYPADGDIECYNANWWGSFDRQGYSGCRVGYYLTGLYVTVVDGTILGLHNIEQGKCCRPRSQEGWGECRHIDVSDSFNDRGWSTCPSDFFLTALYRGHCDRLQCLERFHCCSMGELSGSSWINNPVLSVNVRDTSGQLKQCSMNAMDTTPSTSSYECTVLSVQPDDMLVLDTISFDLEDTSSRNVAEPTRIPGFSPTICSARSTPYRCTKWLVATVTQSNSFNIRTGLTTTVKAGHEVVTGGSPPIPIKTKFKQEVALGSTFNVESGWRRSTDISDKTDVSIEVPSNTELTINMMKTVQDLEYTWKGVFKLLGTYSAKWADGQEVVQDVTTALSGPNRDMYAFGRWTYPDTTFIRVIITDNNGNETAGCDHVVGNEITCDLQA